MIELLAIGAASALVGVLGGAAMGAGTARNRARAEHARELGGLTGEARATQRRSERRESELRAQVEGLRRVCMLPADMSPRDLAARATPRDLDAIVARLRGFAFVDSAVVADAAGLVVSRAESEDGRTGAALAPAILALVAAAELHGLDVTDVRIVTGDARDVTARLLPAWTGPALLVAQSSSQPVSRAAIDSVIAWAEAQAPRHLGGHALTSGVRAPRLHTLLPGSALSGASGTYGMSGARSQALFDELERLRGSVTARAACFVHDGRLVLGVVENGPKEEVCAELCAHLSRFAARARRALRASMIARVEVGTHDGQRIALAPLADHSGFAILTMGEVAAEDVEVARFLGRTRRLLAAWGPERRALAAPGAEAQR